MPPDVRHPAALLHLADGLDEIHRVVGVFLQAGAHGEDVQVEMMSDGSIPLVRSINGRPVGDAQFVLVVAWPLSKAMTTAAAPWR